MMNTIVFATGNKDKLREIGEIIPDCRLVSMAEAGFTGDIEEGADSFRENALIKARAVRSFIGAERPEYADAIVLADDSGLVIDALGGMPGVMSHRWLGERTYPQAMADVLEEMKDVPDEERAARFVCAIGACLPDGREFTVQETVEGIVGHEIIGENGFGYDPFFYLPERGLTTAQLSPDEKNAISHRGKAIRSMKALLEKEGLL